MGAAVNIGINKTSMSRISARASMSRVSATGRVSAGGYQAGGIPGVGGRMVPNAAMLARSSLVKVK